MNWSNWWNGFLTCTLAVTAMVFCRGLWTHDPDKLMGAAVFALLAGVLWTLTFLEVRK